MLVGAFWRFQGSWNLLKPFIIHEKLESRQADLSLPDVLVAVNPQAEFPLQIVDLKSEMLLQPDDRVKLVDFFLYPASVEMSWPDQTRGECPRRL